jgi:hypothetical protein
MKVFFFFFFFSNFLMLLKWQSSINIFFAKFGDIENMKVNDFFYLFIYSFIQLCDVDQNGNHT